MIEDLDSKGSLSAFNQNQNRDFLGFWYQIMNEIGGEMGGRVRGVDDGDYNIGIPIRGYQVFVWRGDIQLLT